MAAKKISVVKKNKPPTCRSATKARPKLYHEVSALDNEVCRKAADKLIAHLQAKMAAKIRILSREEMEQVCLERGWSLHPLAGISKPRNERLPNNRFRDME